MGRGDQKFTIFVSRNIWTPPNNLRSLFRLQCFWRPKTNDYSTFGFEVPHNVYFGAEIPNACHYSTRRDFQTPSLNYSGTSAYEYWTFWHWNSPWLMFWGYVAHPNFHLFAHPNFHLRNEKSLPLILGAEIREKNFRLSDKVTCLVCGQTSWCRGRLTEYLGGQVSLCGLKDVWWTHGLHPSDLSSPCIDRWMLPASLR